MVKEQIINTLKSVMGQKTSIYKEVHKKSETLQKSWEQNNLDIYISLLLFHNRTPDYPLFLVIINTAYILVKSLNF